MALGEGPRRAPRKRAGRQTRKQGNSDKLRQIVLDTETTGLDARNGDRIIEIGCVEILSRSISDTHFHHYLNPEREVEAGATRIHGKTLEDLASKPRFGLVAPELLDYIRGAELRSEEHTSELQSLRHLV